MSKELITPQKKALELFGKFDEMDFHDLANHKESAKDCALIAVDEIMCLDIWDNPFDNIHYGLIFWKQVKDEIEQL